MTVVQDEAAPEPDALERPAAEQDVLQLHAEEISVARRSRDVGTVRVATTTREREQVMDEQLAHQRVEIERVPVGRIVEAFPETREEDGVTIMPVVEEIVVIERKLLLKEEVRIRRVRVTEQFRQTVTLREQEAAVTRTPVPDAGPALSSIPSTRSHQTMNEETIVAVFNTAAGAEAAVSDLKAANVPSGAISVHGPRAAGTAATSGPSGREPGFWSNLFGGHPDHDTSVYQRSIESGATVVTVQTPVEHVETVARILEAHDPVDLDDRASSYGSATTAPATTAPAATTQPAAPLQAPAASAQAGGEAAIALSEEQLAVGKRLVNRGTTRVHRFVVETPLEQDVTLHSEHVTIDRRPAAAAATVTGDAFKDSVVEVSESDEEVVVGKTARVVEEVVIRKEATDRVETVHDTVRREDVEITKDGDTGTAAPTSGADPLTNPRN